MHKLQTLIWFLCQIHSSLKTMHTKIPIWIFFWYDIIHQKRYFMTFFLLIHKMASFFLIFNILLGKFGGSVRNSCWNFWFIKAKKSEKYIKLLPLYLLKKFQRKSRTILLKAFLSLTHTVWKLRKFTLTNLKQKFRESNRFSTNNAK